MTAERIQNLADELDRVLAARPVDPVAAAAVLERAVAACRSDPAAADRWHEPELLDELVDVYEQLGRIDDAIAAMRSAITAGWNGRPDGRCRVAELLMRAGRVAEAAPLWEQVRADTPDDVWLYNNAGLEYADVGDDATALTWLTTGLDLALATGDPEHLVDQLLNLRGAALTRLGRPADRLQTRARQFLDRPTPARNRSSTPPPPPRGPDRRDTAPSAPTAASPFRRAGIPAGRARSRSDRRTRTKRRPAGPSGPSRWPGSRPASTRTPWPAGRSWPQQARPRARSTTPPTTWPWNAPCADTPTPA